MLGCGVLRLASALIVGLLVFSASGVASLVVNEPCATEASACRDEGVCPPTCVTCGCCAQAAEPVALAVSATPDVPSADIPHLLPLPRTTLRDILHVPKPTVT
jgi:hypothetical protein